MTKLQKLPEKRPRTREKRNKSGKMVENRKKRRENGDPGKIIRRFTENHRNNPVRGYTEAVFWYVSVRHHPENGSWRDSEGGPFSPADKSAGGIIL